MEQVKAVEGLEIKYHSERQRLRVESAFRSENYKTKTLVVNQHQDGSLVLHRFYLDEEDNRWRGYAIVIGPRGGKKAHYGYVVHVAEDGELILT